MPRDDEHIDESIAVLDRELRAIRELMAARFNAAELAVKTQAETLETRFEQTNEWRAQLDRERSQFATHDQMTAMAADIKRLEQWHGEIRGALGLLKILSASGVFGLLIELLRMSRVLP